MRCSRKMLIFITIPLIFLATTTSAGTARSYQYVRFLNNKPQQAQQFKPLPYRNSGTRPPRSYHFPVEYFDFPDEIWPESIFIQPDNNLFDVNLGHTVTHYTPDFSNGLEYPDPFLLVGNDAKRAVSYLYGKGELFHQNIPHYKSLLRLQHVRKEEGLPPNRLGSINPRSPLSRDRPKFHSHY